MKLSSQLGMGVSAALGLLGRRRPVNVMASVTDHCPSRCRYCQIPSQNRPDLPTAVWRKLIAEMAAAGTQRIGVWGGEPLTRPDIVELCACMRELGIYVSMDSNGYLLPSRPDVLSSIDHLVLALDGPREAHDANREPGSFDKVMQAIEMASGKVRLWTITVITRNNIDSLGFVLEAARRYGFMATFQTLHHNDILGRNTSELIPGDERYREVFTELLELRRRGSPIALSGRFLRSMSRWPDFSTTRMPGKLHGVRCSAGRMYCNVDVDGLVYPCSLLIGLYPRARSALELGFRAAFEAASELPCQACTATCYTEYNFLYRLLPDVVWDWSRNVSRTDELMRSAASRSKSRREEGNASSVGA
ncbi:radical SAM protein [Candidatus Fermentibacterales bacterium]|nr:radical SAM protein [Candidatus Fermentibacterales bacterium]